MALDGNSWRRCWVTRVLLQSQRSANTFRRMSTEAMSRCDDVWCDAPAGLSPVLSGETSGDAAGDLRSGSQRLRRPGVRQIFTSVCESLTRFLISRGVCFVRKSWCVFIQDYIPTVFCPTRSRDALQQNLTVQCEKMDLPFLSYLPTEVTSHHLQRNNTLSFIKYTSVGFKNVLKDTLCTVCSNQYLSTLKLLHNYFSFYFYWKYTWTCVGLLIAYSYCNECFTLLL